MDITHMQFNIMWIMGNGYIRKGSIIDYMRFILPEDVFSRFSL